MDVATWLRGLGLERYAQAFRDNDVDAELLPQLTAEDLKDIGVGSVGHRRRLLDAIAALDTPVEREPKPLPEGAPRAEAERRQLTVLFCDLVGSTALAGRLDPEDMGEVIRAYQGACAGVINRWDGRVAKYMGDGVLVYFGYPRAHEDDAERAVRAGLELVEAVGRLGEPEAEPNVDVASDRWVEQRSTQPTSGGSAALAVRVGIATGLVVVGDLIGEAEAKERAVVGETPNLAARLQALAGPGDVVIAPSTRHLVAGLFDLADLGEQVLKGFAQPVRAWRVQGGRAAESRFEARHAAGVAPLVGREHELALLLDRWGRAKDGEGQVVLLSGEPGIGKSRIAGGLIEALAVEPHVRLRYQCSPHHTNSAFHPIVEQWERAAGFQPQESPDARLDKLEALLGAAAVGERAPLLAALLGIPPGDRYPPLDLGPERQKQRTLEVLADQIEALAAHQPVLMLCEDAHWIDPSTQETLDLLVERIERLPVLLVMTFRPEHVSPWVGRAHLTQLSLNRLSRRQGAAIVARLAGGKALPAEVLDPILAKTDGVPLFVEELTKTVLESGLLRDAGDRYEVTGPLTSLAIPATLHDSLMARLDRLAPVKEVAQIAAVIGREFPHQLLAAVVPAPEDQLRHALDQLVAAELIFRRGAPPTATYTFKHALVQDAAYQSLLKTRRQALHAKLAIILEQAPATAQQQPELLAHHLSEAGETERAITYWQAAAQLASGHSNYREAVAFFGRGLAALVRLPQSDDTKRQAIDLRLELRPALGALGDYRPIYENLLEAQKDAQSIGDRRRLAQIKADQIHVLYQLGELAAAIEAGETATRLAAEVGDRRSLIQSSFNLGQAYFFHGEHRRAIDIVRPYIDELKGPLRHERLGTTGTSACIWLGNVCGAHARLGEFGAAIAHGEEAARIAGETGRPFDFCLANMWLGMALVAKGEVARAAAIYDRILEITRENELGFVLAWAGMGLGEAYTLSGRAGEAKGVLLESIARAQASKLSIAEAWSTLALGAASLEAGALGDAADHGQRALDIARSRRYRWSEVVALRLLGTACRQLEPPRIEDADRYLSQAVALAEELEARPELAHAWRERGKLYAATGRPIEAKRAFVQALDLYRVMEMTFWLAQTEDLLGESDSG